MKSGYLNFFICKGDKRQLYLAKKFEKLGYDCIYSDEFDEKLQKYKIILLPVSSSAFIFDKIKNYLIKGQIVFGCNISDKKNSFTDIKLMEYMDTDSAAYENAVATAEGAIAQAVILSEKNLQNSECLVAGFGRCGEILALKLKLLGSRVYIVDRSEEKRAKARAYGYNAISFEELYKNNKIFSNMDYLFNTVPSVVFDENILKYADKFLTIVDIASKPGGIDFDFCRQNNIIFKHALGIPGKMAPYTSAEILLKVIMKKISKEYYDKS